jgi:hypothetical protein
MRSKHVFKSTKSAGTVYLLHFCPPYKHAGHYVGFVKGGAKAVRQRLDRHLAGQGARLIEVAALAGCAIRLARMWRHRDRRFERGLKKRRGFSSIAELCPLCRKENVDEMR